MTRRPGASQRADGALITDGPRPERAGGIGSRIADKLTLAQLCEELQISRSTFYDWRAKGRTPRCIKLPNGDLRVRRADLERWLTECEESPAWPT